MTDRDLTLEQMARNTRCWPAIHRAISEETVCPTRVALLFARFPVLGDWLTERGVTKEEYAA